MKKHDYITVLGRNDSKMPLAELREYGPIISVSNHMHDAGHLDYVWTRQEKDLLWFLQQRPSPVDCVTTPELYKKYVFYDQVHSFRAYISAVQSHIGRQHRRPDTGPAHSTGTDGEKDNPSRLRHIESQGVKGSQIRDHVTPRDEILLSLQPTQDQTIGLLFKR